MIVVIIVHKSIVICLDIDKHTFITNIIVITITNEDVH